MTKRMAIGLVLFASSAGAATAQAPVTRIDTLGANFDHTTPGQGTPEDYDFLEGEWTFRFQNGPEGRVQTGKWTSRKTHDGYVVEDVWTLDNSTNPTISYRVFNPERKLWEFQGVKPKTGSFDPAISWSNGDERFIVQTFGKGTLLTRIRYHRITPNHFLWRADGSLDGGKTWMKDMWLIEADRVK